MHIPGILGMPRRIYTYAADRGWGALNLVCTVGAVFQALGLLVFVFQYRPLFAKGTAGWERSVGCMDSGVDDQFTAARIQLRRASRREEPPPTLGP